MVKIKDLVEVKKESFFDGAVQSDWFYNNNMREKVSERYIFHGPKYYGVKQNDVSESKHKLLDTASFTNKIFDKIYNDTQSSRFALTIAGYGAGKSHLSLTMATLLSGLDIEGQGKIINNIKNADYEIGNQIESKIKDKHFVIVLNGINDFNLNNEILKSAKKTLEMHGLDDSIFNDMSVAYKMAETFLDRMYAAAQNDFETAANEFAKYKRYKGEELKQYLKANVYEDVQAFTIINKVFEINTGSTIKIEQAISANTILTKIHQKYVVEEKRFKSVLVIFDEFGRYLEYASSHPSIAGETAIQQIFEAVQNCKPTMLFIGFIQSDLSTYLSRVNNDNIVRYVGRYEGSDKYYLSSNLETVIASLVEKKDKKAEEIISNIFDSSLNSTSNRLFNNIKRWIPELSQKSVWADNNMFLQILSKGCYPIHPVTTAFLSALSVWMQQRSTLSFISDIFSKYEGKNLDSNIPFINAVSVINSPIFDELLNAEERGRQQGQNCSKYNELIDSYGERLTQKDKDILAAILVSNIMKFKTYDKADCITALEACIEYSENGIKDNLKSLESNMGIIYFDENINRYQFMSEGNSKVDFNKEFLKKRAFIKKDNIIEAIPEDIKKQMNILDNQATPFGMNNSINTQEWSFEKRFISIEDFNTIYADNLKRDCAKRISPEEAKGIVIFLYCSKDNYHCVNNVIKIYKENYLKDFPIIIYIINDNEGSIIDGLLEIKTLAMFSSAEREKFAKYIRERKEHSERKVVRTFSELARNRQVISEDGLTTAQLMLQLMCKAKLEEIYTQPVPFTIDGFEKKLTKASRNNYYNIIEVLLLRKFENPAEFNTLQVEVRNRINSLLSVNSQKSWKVLYNNSLGEAQNLIVKKISEDIFNEIKTKGEISFANLVNKYVKPPYGMNIYSISLLIIYVMALNKDNIQLVQNNIAKKRTELISHLYNDKKEPFDEFKKYTLRYTEETQGDKIGGFLNRLETIKGYSIEKCEELLNECNRLMDEDISEEHLGRLLHHKDTLEIAARKNREINVAISTSIQELKDIKLTSVPTLYNRVKDIKEGVIKDMQYTYSVNQIENAEKIRKQIISYTRNNYKAFADNAPFDRLNEVKTVLLRTGKFLKVIGEIELSDEILNSIKTIEAKAIKLQEIRKLKLELSKKLDDIKNEIKYANDLDKALDLVKVVISQIEQRGTSNNYKQEYELAKKFEQDIESIKSKSYEKLEEINEVINSIKTVSALNSALMELRKLSNDSIIDAVKSKINEFEQDFATAYYKLKEIENMNISMLELSKFIRDIQENVELQKTRQIIELIGNEFKQKLLMKEEAWCKKYLLDDTTIENLSVNELIKWKNETVGTLSKYSSKTIEGHDKVLQKVNDKLSKYKIDNILELFKELSGDEQNKCIKLLNNI